MTDRKFTAAERIARARKSGRYIAVGCAAFAFGMVGAAYASVPLYQLFCQITGYGGTTQRADAAPSEIVDVPIRVRFDGNVAKGLPWSFRPNDRSVEIKLGEVGTTSYRVTNRSDEAVTGQALFNVTPLAAGVYFNKIACFCFTEQTLKPGETMDMPITFFIDPAIRDAEEITLGRSITLSYTFFPVESVGEIAQGPVDEVPITDQAPTQNEG